MFLFSPTASHSGHYSNSLVPVIATGPSGANVCALDADKIQGQEYGSHFNCEVGFRSGDILPVLSK